MANASAVCLSIVLLFCCSSLSLGRQLPKECSKGPQVWCQSLRQGASCGAVGHCIATVWETQNEEISSNEISDKFIRLFKQMKDVRELINEEYLATRVSSACKDIQQVEVSKLCKENTAKLESYLIHVLKSNTSPENMCRIVGMCNNKKIDNYITLDKKKVVESKTSRGKLLGSEQCTWGPSYWCSNFSTGRECKATHHCVTRVWSQIAFPADNDSVCKICTDMVTQARDQLQSNETQEELKEVFEGSCKLIPLKIVAKECIKLADDFVPELVETLASQMNPQAVCSVAGLCNNSRIDKLLEGYYEQLQLRVECNNCNTTVVALRKKFDTTSYEDFLVGLLKACRNFGSLSDSCSMLVFKYYENIVEAARMELTPQSVCHASGQCAYRYHQHPDYTFPELQAQPTDDVPCELCEQLVKHLRDVIIANTTELEFYKVLKGLCKQTGTFKDECLHLAEQYYPLIYQYLVKDLEGDKICEMIGVCGKKVDVPVAPLVPRELTVKVVGKGLIGADEASSYKPKPEGARQQTDVGVLPIERMFVGVPAQSKAACSFCQYFLHYLQVELSDSKVEDKITSAVNKACDALPKSVEDECEQFVSQYGPAVIALLVQEIDPASVCPALGICPKTEEVRLATNVKSNCPLCLFAVEQLVTTLKTNRSKEVIREALDNLCTHLSDTMRPECVNFVDTYSQQLVEMLAANMDAQEVCVFLKVCPASRAAADPLRLAHPGVERYHERPALRGDRNNFRRKSLLPGHMLEGTSDIETNEIHDNTVNGRPTKPVKGPKTLCVICEFVLKEIDDEIKDKHNEDDIKKAVHSVCKRMPKSVSAECDQFVDKYADLVISLLAQELDPSEVCEELKLCPPSQITAARAEEILDCAVCETVVMAVKKVLTNEKVDRNIVHIVEKSCNLLPAKYSARCHTMLEIYGESVIHLIEQYGVKGVCQKIGLCSPQHAFYVRMYHED